MPNEVAVMSINELQTIAVAMHKGGLFGFKNPEQAFSLMILAQAQGQHPATIVQDYHIFSTGKASLRSDTVLARFQKQAGTIEWLETTDTLVRARFSHPSSGSHIFEWTIEDAKRANLLGKDVWKAYPADMLRARCIYRGVRAMLPMVFGGMYGKEEMEDSGLDRDPVKTEHEVVSSSSPSSSIPTEPDKILTSVGLNAAFDEVSSTDNENWKQDFQSVRTKFITAWRVANKSKFPASITAKEIEAMQVEYDSGSTWIQIIGEQWKRLSAPAPTAPQPDPAEFIARVIAVTSPDQMPALESEFDKHEALHKNDDVIAAMESKRADFDDGMPV